MQTFHYYADGYYLGSGRHLTRTEAVRAASERAAPLASASAITDAERVPYHRVDGEPNPAARV